MLKIIFCLQIVCKWCSKQVFIYIKIYIYMCVFIDMHYVYAYVCMYVYIHTHIWRMCTQEGIKEKEKKRNVAKC